ncbi:TPA: UDP-3-O-(3-hydroxymyristoyl)glucosamine N-acyltransferase [Candidatus Poribacteria bacterium]|nr:UDP-3-O-(3-hydroxymyristoyl)glucosamine N-acyltransferase [Candidatus Poribacteria bacterium]HIC16898.1 UDP-3-O-(3-hydroxymyristoyl)glucosamine N-acyltransferase [Candidatus Poribacteria bacterium]HIM10743.1 UDP-3-O-(3-hydroxymyristoyl)glucosamine N-acyltransferase [Candidatus Poribacteria bacterium]HIO78077.1 UDP-3-O-(3-hydroxymyristoyl)glucosamine N-acyltransferase [Candidatus Poribacteria bacterium]
MVLKLVEISEIIVGELIGNGAIEIYGVSGIEEARKNEITFLANPKYRFAMKNTQASAVIVGKGVSANGSKSLIRVDNPYHAFIAVLKIFSEGEQCPKPGISSSAKIGNNVKCGDGVSIQAYVIIEDNVTIGNDTVIGASTFIGDSAEIGSQTYIYPNVTVREKVRIGNSVILHSGTVVGSDGFGYATVGETHHKIPQFGTVIIEDDVEIGANSTVDRATINNRATIIRRGTKIDNLVQVAHNVEIGENCRIAALTGISGSVKIGDRVTLAGQSGVVGHLTIGSDNIALAKSGITKNLPDRAGKVSGFPARAHNQQLKIQALNQKLPSTLQEISELCDRIEELEKKLGI